MPENKQNIKDLQNNFEKNIFFKRDERNNLFFKEDMQNENIQLSNKQIEKKNDKEEFNKKNNISELYY